MNYNFAFIVSGDLPNYVKLGLPSLALKIHGVIFLTPSLSHSGSSSASGNGVSMLFVKDTFVF